jgi:hypothetical protein
VRVACTADHDVSYPARILEVYGPDGAAPLLLERAIVAANDGGRWTFETAGRPFPFEDTERYTLRRKSDRFPADLLYDYLQALSVPFATDPDWDRAHIVEHIRSND